MSDSFGSWNQGNLWERAKLSTGAFKYELSGNGEQKEYNSLLEQSHITSHQSHRVLIFFFPEHHQESTERD